MKRLFCLVVLLTGFWSVADAVEVPILEATTFTRAAGRPVTETVVFQATAGSAVLKVLTGGGSDSSTSSARISVNGRRIVAPRDLKRRVTELERHVVLTEGDNRLTVSMRGKPGSQLVVSILREVDSITEAEAIKLVRDVILPREVPPEGAFSAMLIPGELPQGTPVYEGGPVAPGLPSDVIGVPGGPAPVLHAAEDSFFFFLDLAPHHYYEHPVKYILVGRSGAHQVAEANWWPVINGSIPPQLQPRNPAPELVVAERDVSRRAPAELKLDYVLPSCDDCIFDLIEHEGFIIVQGLQSGDKLFNDASLTHANGVFFFQSYINNYLGTRGRLEGLAESDADNVLSEIDTMAAEGRDVITIYIIAHGSTDSIGLGGIGFSADVFRSKFAQYPGIQFNFLLGSCNSGSFIDNLQTEPNVTVVGTAVANGEGATPDWDAGGGLNDVNIYDFGSEWTSSVLDAGRIVLADPARTQAVFDLAVQNNVPRTSMLIYQSLLGATGNNQPFGLGWNLDLSNRLGDLDAATHGSHNPQIYRSWP